MSSIITKIEAQKKNKDRVNIYINNEFAFACGAEFIYIHSITKGKSMEKSDLEDIICEDNYLKGKNCALHFLERSFKSYKQVVDKLTEKEFDIKTIDRVMEFLKQYDFIDDKRFVELFIKEKIRSSGKNKIKFALLKKGLSEELIKEELNEVTNEQQLEIAMKLAEKKIGILSKSEKDIKKLYKKTSDYLVRNGYDFALVSEVLGKITKDMDGEEDKEKDFSEDTSKDDYEKLYNLASKRYNVLIKSEHLKIKLYKKLGDYLLRRGFQWDQIKKVLADLISDVEEV
ncbi:recombination regulator RecX [Clostridium sp. CS001]|uniref:recombination regulator RecX n=1 Tax=Clostridium sp. CS001 TaxID=2880648 RepID=UPI001CF5CC2B|nr:recombination regulator RecX [Clostridium sp. CS001]MCB2289583.1 recombination regulator RecX [Clostridium sp. CS001]